MRIGRVLTGAAVAALIAGCGVDGVGEGNSAPADVGITPPPVAGAPFAAVTTPRSPGAVRRQAAPDPVVADVPAGAAVPELQDLEQPAIWPAADVVFATPEEAAADFVRELLISEGEPEFGEFQQGDSRSGEISVLFAGEDGTLDPPIEKGLLALRQLGPDDGWFVVAAASEGADIASPAALATVVAGPLIVEGEARGFEATVVVSAFPAGDIGTMLDQQITRGGAFADLEPYSVVLDLSNAAPGEVVALLVQGDTGLGSDPSDFAAIPVVIEELIPPTR